MNLQFLATDNGPRETLELLAAHFNSEVYPLCTEFVDGQDALVLSPSTSAVGSFNDMKSIFLARALGIPVIAVEDYSGNSIELVNRNLVDYVVVESEYVARFYVRRGYPDTRIKVIPSIRFDHYRERSPAKLRFWGRHSKGFLWAAQPQNAINQSALGSLVPWLHGQGATVFFRRHPADNRYDPVAWANWFKSRGIKWVDCSKWAKGSVWRAPIALAGSAFSSLSIEAGFHGILSVHLLSNRPARNLLGKEKSDLLPSIVALKASGGGKTMKITEEMHSVTSYSRARSLYSNFVKTYHATRPALNAMAAQIRDIINTRLR